MDQEALIADGFQFYSQWGAAMADGIVSQIGNGPGEADGPHPTLQGLELQLQGGRHRRQRLAHQLVEGHQHRRF